MKRRMHDRTLRLLVGSASIAVMLTLWQLFADSGAVDIRFSSSPLRIARSASDMFGSPEFLMHAGSSLAKFVWGMLWACIVGIPLGVAMGRNKRLRLVIEPIVMVFYSVPSTTFLPLIILWFGIGLNAYALLVFMGAVFPILLNSAAGIRQVDDALVRAARSFGASELDLFRFVLVPSALPLVMGGIRLGLGRGLMAVIFGEMYFSVAGMGHLIMRYQAGLNTDKLMFLVVVTAFFGVALIALARRVEAWLGPWRQTREVE
jgi:NitT/TauT family transport system permease protein